MSAVANIIRNVVHCTTAEIASFFKTRHQRYMLFIHPCVQHQNSNALTATGIAALQATKVNVTTESQHGNAGGEFGDGEIPEYLFEGDIE